MNPLGMVIAKVRGAWEYGSDSNLLLMHFPDYLLISVAMVIAYVVNRLGQQVSRERQLGSYQVGELLGEGGMGMVYRATHRMLARPAAIKLIQPGMIGGNGCPTREIALKRFRREAAVAASLRSPHTVQLYDFGLTENQSLYFVMELLDGMTLDTLVHDFGPVPANRAIHILGQVCESLEEAHALGLVHRDIKPGNIHIGRLGLRHDFVKVLDFGLVKSLTEVSSEGSLVTGLGMPPGTPAYMAPEVTQGETFDGRADIYAVGCVAYYLLTGQPTFEGANPIHVIARHLNEVPVPPSQHAGISIPPALDRLVLACLAKRPDGRPCNAAELARSLAAVEVEPWGEAHAAAWWKAVDARAS
jgi:serine/threonine-protein kinase